MATPYDDLRLDSGLAITDLTTFTNAELDSIWSRVSSASSDAIRHEAALGLMARQMLAKLATLHDQSVVQSSSKQSQIWEHWKYLYEMYKPSLEAALGQSKQFVIGAVRPVKHQTREKPDESGKVGGLFE